MNHIEKQHCLEWIAYLIQNENTGTPKELVQRCNLDSEKTLSRLIDILRQYTGIADAKNLYDRERKTYYYEPKGKFTDFKFVENDTNQTVTN